MSGDSNFVWPILESFLPIFDLYRSVLGHTKALLYSGTGDVPCSYGYNLRAPSYPFVPPGAAMQSSRTVLLLLLYMRAVKYTEVCRRS